VRGARPRETAVGKLMRQLARDRAPDHPVLAGPGWWEREERFFCVPAQASQPMTARPGG